MTNFKITFSNPWLLLLLIPAIALTLFPYFRVAKKYRRNRNRIVSVVLHSLVMVLCISLLSGMMFLYDIPNKENEIIILVDSSYSNTTAAKDKDDFIQSVIDECGSNYQVGMVKFGYDQVYAAELSDDARGVYRQYIDSKDPDTSATDFSAALTYAGGLFKHKETAKILLISDGFETDGNSLGIIKSLAAEGIRVDVAHFPNETHEEVQVVAAATPDYNVKAGADFNVSLTLVNNFAKSDAVAVTIYDTDETGEEIQGETIACALTDKTQTVDIKHKVERPGMHQLRFVLDTAGKDDLEENNEFYAYLYLNAFDNILIIENKDNESEELQTFFKENANYNVTALSIEADIDELPENLAELCEYEQVILVNVAYKDMPHGFEEILYRYVNDQGGGLFTVGGENDTDTETGNPVPHAYNRDDMLQSKYYQQLLPVQVINYTPPVAVMLIIDHSGSMGEGPSSPLGVAKNGAYACLDVLQPRDYCGVMTLDNRPDHVLPMTPVSQKETIRDAINNISNKGEGGTIFSAAVETAGDMLAAVDVEKRHIILVTDGKAADHEANPEQFKDIVKKNLNRGVTFSIVAYGASPEEKEGLKEVTDLGQGGFYDVKNGSVNEIATYMEKDLKSEAIAEIAYGEEFVPVVRKHTSAVAGIETATFPKLKGYYGTREKEGADIVLVGKYVPIYAQWKFGKGMVGSFMCDLNGTMSGEFLNNEVGKTFIRNVVDGLFPVEDVKPNEFNLNVKEDNYTTQINVSSELKENEKIELEVEALTESANDYYSVNQMPISVSEGYTRFTVVITQPGVYKMTLSKKDASGAVIATHSFYKTFSYSQEYNMFSEKSPIGEELLQRLAADGNGIVAEDALDVFDSFKKFLNREFDPRILFLVLAIIFFLLDVAVRKFKFKWPHEIIRDYRQKKEMNKDGQGKK